MHSRHLRWYALALAVVIVGLAVVGVPMVALVLLSCPLVVMLMTDGQDQRGGIKPPDPSSRHNRGSI
ncbi:DUF2933 domain-containing protein [Nocardia pseudovaccinii]|uniref:DUF2933 domain-containing protein n=1 Tax=Nocardia pseudovaccinii TaxID=189540 RepID=UPI003D90F5A5